MAHNKQKRLNARVTQAHYNKLMSILNDKGMTISEWVREKIENLKAKK